MVAQISPKHTSKTVASQSANKVTFKVWSLRSLGVFVSIGRTFVSGMIQKISTLHPRLNNPNKKNIPCRNTASNL